MSYRRIMVFGVALLAGVMGTPLLAKEYFVAQSAANASDENPGTEAAPWKTINRSIKSVAPGDTVHIGGGVYREQIVLAGQAWDFDGVTYPKAPAGTSFGNMISFVGESRENVVIKGSDVVTDWKPYKDAIWVRDNWQPNSQQVFVDGKAITQIGGKMSSRFDGDVNFSPTSIKPKWLGRKGKSLNDIEAGSFYVDLDAKKLYIWLADGSEPGKHVIEAGVRTFGICLYDTQYIKLANLSIHHVNSSAESSWGGINVFGAGHIIDNLDVSWNDSTGLHIKGANHTIVNSIFDYNGNCGITGDAKGVRLINSRTNYNNRRNWESNWHAGGIKIIPNAQDWLVSGHVAAYNNGHAIWFDSWNSRITIENSRVNDNRGMGIFYEVSERAVIVNNVIYNNRDRGIYISNSANCLIAHNLLVGNGMSGVVVVGINRKAPPMFGHPETNAIFANNNYVLGNIFVDNCHPDRVPRKADGTDLDGSGTSWTIRPELILPDFEMPSNQNCFSDYNVFYRSGNRTMSFWAGWGKAGGAEVAGWGGDQSESAKRTKSSQAQAQPQGDALAAWQKWTGNDKHSVIAEPLFVDPANFDFHPQKSSPIYIVPGLPSIRDDADGKHFAVRKNTALTATGGIEVGVSDTNAAAGPYAGE